MPTTQKPKAKVTKEVVNARIAAEKKSNNGKGTRTKAATLSLRKYSGNSSKAMASLIDVNKPLTEMQRSFAKHWAQGETILTASLKAGYATPELGYRLVVQPNVLALYRQEKALYEASCQMTRAKVMDGFLEAIEFAKACNEPGSMISGWREVAKMCGYYEPVKVRITHTTEGKAFEDRMNSMTNEDLMQLVMDQALAIRNGTPDAAPGAPA